MKWVTMILVVILNDILGALVIWLVSQHRPDWLVFVVVIVMLLTAGRLSSSSDADDKQEEKTDEPR